MFGLLMQRLKQEVTSVRKSPNSTQDNQAPKKISPMRNKSEQGHLRVLREPGLLNTNPAAFPAHNDDTAAGKVEGGETLRSRSLSELPG